MFSKQHKSLNWLTINQSSPSLSVYVKPWGTGGETNSQDTNQILVFPLFKYSGTISIIQSPAKSSVLVL